MEIKEDKSFGIIPVFKNEKDDFLFCLVKHAEGHWGFPKGHPEVNESEQQTAVRELREETGIDTIKLFEHVSFTEKYSFLKNGFKYNKSVKYFLSFISSIETMTLNNFKKEIPELKWVIYEEAKQLLTFPEAKEVLNQVFNYLMKVEGTLK